MLEATKKISVGKIASYYKAWEKSDCLTIDDFYKSYSQRKASVEHQIRFVEMKEHKGHRYRVLSGNCHFFTCAYETDDGLFVVHTPYHRYVAKVDDIMEYLLTEASNYV